MISCRINLTKYSHPTSLTIVMLRKLQDSQDRHTQLNRP